MHAISLTRQMIIIGLTGLNFLINFTNRRMRNGRSVNC